MQFPVAKGAGIPTFDCFCCHLQVMSTACFFFVFRVLLQSAEALLVVL
jgi:hypothetical protein